MNRMWVLWIIPYSLIFSRIKYFAVWLNSAQKHKIFVVNVQPAKTAKIFNLENFRLYGSIDFMMTLTASHHAS